MDEPVGWREGSDGLSPRYREWLYPRPVLLLLVLGLAALVGVAYGAAYGAGLGWATGLILAAAAAAFLAVTSTPIRVDDKVVRAGRARLPLDSIGHALPLSVEQMRRLRSHGDPRNYLVLRTWASPRGVQVVLDDAHDPHPHWIITSRSPERLAEAIDAARGIQVSTLHDPQ